MEELEITADANDAVVNAEENVSSGDEHADTQQKLHAYLIHIEDGQRALDIAHAKVEQAERDLEGANLAVVQAEADLATLEGRN